MSAPLDSETFGNQMILHLTTNRGPVNVGLRIGPVLFAEHHESHAASAFYPSPFAEAAVLTMDGL